MKPLIGLDWLSALRALAIRKLAAEDGPLQLSLFDEREMAEIESPDYPGERLILGSSPRTCRNPPLAEERARKRAELLEATERDLARIQARVQRARRPLRGADKIGLAVGAVLGRRKVAKHFQITITKDDLGFRREEASIATEAELDGIYVLRTNVSPEDPSAAEAVTGYKGLSHVERAFRSIKTVHIELRPVYHRVAPPYPFMPSPTFAHGSCGSRS